MGNLFSSPLFQAIDGNGKPLAGAKLATYSVGTTTDKATFTTNARTVEHANPVILNSEGRAEIHLLGTYNMNLTTKDDAQVPGWPIDNIGETTDLAAGFFPDAAAADQGVTGDGNTIKSAVDSIGATNKGTIYLRHAGGGEFTDYTFSTSETIPTNIILEFEPGARLSIDSGKTVTHHRLPRAVPGLQIFTGSGTAAFRTEDMDSEVYPEWWGAVGDDSTDDTTALQAAIDSDMPVRLAAKKYQYSNLQTKALTQISGVHKMLSWLKRATGSTGIGITDSTSGTAAKLILQDMTLSGNSTTGDILDVGNNTTQFGTEGILRNLHIRDCTGYGWKINGNAGLIENISTTLCTSGALLSGSANVLSGVIFALDATYAFEIDGTQNVVNGIHVEGTMTTAFIRLNNAGNIINGATLAIEADDTLPAAFRIESGFGENAFKNITINIAASLVAGSTILTDIIDDNGGTQDRNVPGSTATTATVTVVLPDYTSSDNGTYIHYAAAPPTTGTWRLGDITRNIAALAGEVTGWECITAGTPGTWVAMALLPGAVAKTATYTVLATEDGKCFSNTGAGGAIEFDLPALADHLRYTVIRFASQTITIDPNASEVIRGGGGGKYLSLDSDGARVTLEAHGSNWEIIESIGTTSFEA